MTWAFIERGFQTYCVDLRLFIEGIEVTPWLQDDISWSLAGTGGVNSLSFTLANPEDIWFITPDNLEGKWRMSPSGLYSEAEKRSLYERKTVREDEARSVMEKYKTHDQLRSAGLYGMGPHTLVFHKNDAVRLFVRNPLVVEDWWMCAFTGFIAQKPVQEDYMVGSGPITISCYCLKGIMQKMRVQENPMPTAGDKGSSALKDALDKSGYLGPEAGPFEDLLLAGGNHPLAGKDFMRSIDLLFFGKEGVQPGGVSTARIKIFGGTVTTSVAWPSNQPQKNVPLTTAEEQAVHNEIAVLNGLPQVRRCGGIDDEGRWYDEAKRDAVYTSSSTQDKGTIDGAKTQASLLAKRLADIRLRADVAAKGKKAIGAADPSTQPKGPSAVSGRTAMLRGHVGRFAKGETFNYPGDDLEEWHNLCLLGNRAGFYMSFDQATALGQATVLENVEGSPWNGYVHMLLPKDGLPVKDFVQTQNTVNDFVASGVNFTDRYQLVNLVCEQIEYQWYVTPVGDVVFEFPMFDFEPSAWKGYAAVHRVEKHATSSAIEDEAEEIPTAIVVTAQERHADASATGGLGVAGDPNRVVAYAPLLATRLGVVVEQLQAPPSVGGTTTGTSQKDLEAWGALQLQKRLGRSSTMTIPTGWRPWMLPNRVIEHRLRERLGVATTVQHTVALGGICTTTPTIVYTKKKGPDGTYRYISGGENMPLNYSTGITKSGDVDRSGIVIRKGVQKGTSQGTAPQPPPVRNSEYKPTKRTKSDDALDPLLKELRPEFADVVADVLRELRAAGWKPKIRSAYRSIEKQNKLVAAGGTVAKCSRHTMGLAVDLIDKRFGWPAPKLVWGYASLADPGSASAPPDTFQWPIQPTPARPPKGSARLFGATTLNGKNIHMGLDFGTKGQRVLAARAGQVIAAAGPERGRGIYVIIRHDGGWMTRYYHLDSYTTVRGANVVAGQQIGIVGATGGALGPHLHFEVLRNGANIDPLTVLDPKANASANKSAQNIVAFYRAVGAAAMARGMTWGGNINQRGFGPESNIQSGWYRLGMGWDPVHFMWPITKTPVAWQIDWKGGSAPTDRGRQSAPV
jgi:murein DD-endopeptidase MepM/ murein hydrolase activator NlpD